MNGTLGPNDRPVIHVRQVLQGGTGEGEGGGIVLGRGEVAAKLRSAFAGQDPGKTTKTAQAGTALGILMCGSKAAQALEVEAIGRSNPARLDRLEEHGELRRIPLLHLKRASSTPLVMARGLGTSSQNDGVRRLRAACHLSAITTRLAREGGKARKPQDRSARQYRPPNGGNDTIGTGYEKRAIRVRSGTMHAAARFQ